MPTAMLHMFSNLPLESPAIRWKESITRLHAVSCPWQIMKLKCQKCVNIFEILISKFIFFATWLHGTVVLPNLPFSDFVLHFNGFVTLCSIHQQFSTSQSLSSFVGTIFGGTLIKEMFNFFHHKQHDKKNYLVIF